MTTTTMNQMSFEEFIFAVKNVYVAQVEKVMRKRCYSVFLEFDDVCQFTLPYHTNTDRYELGDDPNKMKFIINDNPVLGFVRIDDILNTGQFSGRFRVDFFIGNICRFFYTKYLNEGEKCFLKLIKLIKHVVRHECLHMHQFLYLAKNSKKEEILYTFLKFCQYMQTTVYTKQIHEIEAEKFAHGMKITKISDYMKQFLIAA